MKIGKGRVVLTSIGEKPFKIRIAQTSSMPSFIFSTFIGRVQYLTLSLGRNIFINGYVRTWLFGNFD